MPRTASPLALGLALLLTLAPLAPEASAQEVTGLDGWSLYLDPGHSGTDENVGIYGYSEPQKVLRVGLALKEMLETRTDIEVVYISRENDQVQVGLSQRSDEANSLGADFFHSIHSNAAGPGTNNTLMLYGGWRRNGETVEKTPNGGALMGDLYIESLTAAMRIPTIGNFADRTFYQGFPENHDNQFSFLSVNRRTNMASVLSEGGFHTNPRQNTLNMNAEWKVLEAQAFFWAILEYHGLARTPDRIATGIVTDGESGIPINGATVEIAGQTYTTDTYESLFNQYSNDPDQLHNGFYYLPEMPTGTFTATFTAPGYRTATGQIVLLEGEFTFLDAALISTVPPIVEASSPEAGQNPFRVSDPLRVTFSRPMDRAATEAAFTLASGGDTVNGTFAWAAGDTELTFTPEADLSAETMYTLRIADSAVGTAGDGFDGDADGTAGEAFEITFTTGFPDTTAPRIAGATPEPGETAVERRPIITVTYTEPLDPDTVPGRVRLRASSGEVVPGTVQYRRVGEAGVISFFPSEPLAQNAAYRLDVLPGLRDLFLNEQTGTQGFPFTTGDQIAVPTVMDSFEGDVAGNWWQPQKSGSTTGIATDSTASGASSEVASLLYSGDTALSIQYGWRPQDTDWLIRQYRDVAPPNARTFTGSATLRAAVFGDGSGTLFRFAARDDGSIEVSPWTTIDWVGWRNVTWDISADGFGTWISPDGVLTGSGYFDSFQLAYNPSAPSAEFGEIWVDDLQLIELTSVDSEPTPEAVAFQMSEAFPNPVRSRATLRLTLAEPTPVTATVYSATGAEIARLASGETWSAGTRELTWDASGVASGVYFVRVQAGEETSTARLTVVR